MPLDAAAQALSARLPGALLRELRYSGFILVRPFGHSKQRVAAANLTTGQVIISDGALDVFGQHYVAEVVNGKEVGLYEMARDYRTVS